MRHQARSVGLLLVLALLISAVSLTGAQEQTSIIRNQDQSGVTLDKHQGVAKPMFDPNAAIGTRVPPTNDNFADAVVLTEADLPYTATVTDVQDATKEAGEEDHSCGFLGDPGENSVWYKLSLSTEYKVTLSLSGSSYTPGSDTILSIFTGSALGSLTEVFCNDDSTVSGGYYSGFNNLIIPAGEYYIKISSWALLTSGTLSINITGTEVLPAGNFTVDTTNDTADATLGDGICADSTGACSLRAALQESSSLAAGSTIALPAGTYTTAGTTLPVATDITVTGAGAETTIINRSGGASIITVGANSTFNLSGVTLTGGSAAQGGGIYAQTGSTLNLSDAIVTGNSATNVGAGLAVDKANLTNVEVTNNTGGPDAWGGGIFIGDSGVVTIANSTIANNSTGVDGGGISNDPDAVVTITNSTITGNSANAGAAFDAYQGAVYTITNATITGNTGDTTVESTIFASEAVLSTINYNFVTIAHNNAVGLSTGHQSFVGSIVYGNTGGDCLNTDNFVTDGNNLFSASGGCVAGASDIISSIPADSILATSLADNGGDTQTLALVSGSPAVDGITSASVVVPAADQRGETRPAGAAADIGAFELQDDDVVVTPEPTGTATATPEPTGTATATPEPTGTATVTPEPTEEPVGTELLVNGDLEGNIEDAWKVKNATKDKQKCDKPEKDKFFANTGECAFLFKGGANENSKILQKPSVDGVSFAAGDTLTFSGFVNAKKELSAKYKVVLKYSDNDEKTKINGNLAVTDGYEAFGGDATLLSANVSKIKALVVNKSTSGKFFVDTLSLRVVSAGEETDGLLGLPAEQQ